MSHHITKGTFQIFTYKEGLLSKVAHDLRISVPRFDLHIDGEEVRLTVPTTSFIVDGAMKKGTLQEKTLSAKDKRDILANIDKDVLKTRTFPELRYQGKAHGSDGARFRVEGTLEIVGRRGPLTVEVERQGKTLRARAEIIQSRFGIKPFSAMLGTLKVKDRLEVVVEVQEG